MTAGLQTDIAPGDGATTELAPRALYQAVHENELIVLRVVAGLSTRSCWSVATHRAPVRSRRFWPRSWVFEIPKTENKSASQPAGTSSSTGYQTTRAVRG